MKNSITRSLHPSPLNVELSAVIVAVTGEGKDTTPRVMVTVGMALPSGPFGMEHRTLEQGLRAWVRTQSGRELGYVEQLYTFADKDRTRDQKRIVSIGYLALTRETSHQASLPLATNWYAHFPWEDRRQGAPQPLTNFIQTRLAAWRGKATSLATRRAREERIALAFPKDPRAWNDELVLQRYELLWEAGLIDESPHKSSEDSAALGLPMAHDHRRILATGIARLRAKIKYRPVVFELMPDRFTLLHLQSVVEALAGCRLHKQNFRRLVQSQGLVEETKGQSTSAKGRPAQLFAFRREVLRERAVVGTKLPRPR